jgi:hypothetical protein
MSGPPLRIGISIPTYDRNVQMARGVSRSVASLGYTPVDFADDDILPAGLDLVITIGPLSSLVPLANQLIACPPSQRPPWALIHTEPLPNPDLPEWFRRGFGALRSRAERAIFYQVSPGLWRPSPSLRRLLRRAHRYRYYGDLFWLREQGVLTVLALWSRVIADSLRAQGFDPIVLTGGYQLDWGCDLGLARDIPVLWLGKPVSGRRVQLLSRLRQELDARGVPMMVVDGVEHPFVIGEERTILLNRTRIMVNLVRQKYDDNSMRYPLAAHNRVLLVSEPTLRHTYFEPGVHLVETPISRMAETICYYLQHDDERKRIVDNAYEFVAANARPGQAIAQVIARALDIHPPHPS